ncbi:uncharacterized protein HMPREF1541_06986 [Cyphellophora europaea CBS 101466]|uniref:phosphoinositide 5-phosphatase n=1 Tax=Cyphellophora europaea (strain CBS 101466) TaxID=1220924 RepID=W2RTB4_CYPE1|nr:uncharacterized protein HMPREF1541_06986 [Cyphellophora europaea CBS 101466]ETN38944.1 hypothetical protein HMPREF1541_06986 [Cyphellophora europaea CBS 101466]
MSMKVLINDHPHRTLAIATDTHALFFRHTHSADESKSPSSTSLPLPSAAPAKSIPRCMVEFSELSNFDLSQHRNVAAARGTLGVITLNSDVFICVVTGSVEVAKVRPGETVQRIYSVEFYCLNRNDYDHSHGHLPNPYPGQEFASEEFEYGSGLDTSDTLAEHPFHALQKLLSGGNFYYSVDFDLTRRLQDRVEDTSLDIATLDEGLLWNSYMINPLLQFRARLTHHEKDALDGSRILTSVIRGFARTLTVPPSSSPIRRKVSNMPASLTVVSRLSSRRAGTRFNSRGIDDNGNVANFVETETIFWSPTGLCFSYVQVRGSVPLFWESSSSLIPGQQKIQITRSPEATQPSFDKHFAGLENNYGAIHIVNLLSASKPGEHELTQRYREHVRRSPLRRSDPNEFEDHNLLRSTEFDFHEHARGQGYDVTQAFRPYVDLSAESFVYFLSEELEEWTTSKGKPKKVSRAAVIMQQNGVFRVNCLDCLDRTNLVQGMISRMSLELFLSHRSERANSDFWMRHDTLWADNGDALSKIYAGTGALKSSFTRHGKMSLGGALADVRKSATRLYVNHFEDKGRQNTVDLLLGRLVGQSSVDLFDPINDWVVNELSKRRGEFESRSQVKVFVGTFNLNGKTGGTREELSAWLKPGPDFDIVVVGFQEIVDLSPQQIMSTDPNRRMVWESVVRGCLNGHTSEKPLQADGDEYVLLRSGQLVGAALLIFVRAHMLDRVKNVEGAIKKTGMSGIAGNKGAVACRMEIDSTSVCFVTAHLAAGFGNYDERNRDYNTITSGLHFQRERHIDDHEVIVWAGDFNYRIGLSYENAKSLVQQAIKSQGSKREDALGSLYENDQLNIQMVAGNCFDFYREGKVDFLPTYKYDIGKDDFDSSEKARIPAWTDRILYKVNHRHSMSGGQGEELGTKVRLDRYDSVQHIRISDHRPVFATFEIGVRVIDETKKDALTHKLYMKRAREVKAAMHAEDYEDDSSDIDDVVGYEAIQEGLPPASSDRRKWWLDGDKAVRAGVQPPEKGMMLNPKRKSNPWRPSDGVDEEDEWVKVDKLNLSDSAGTSGKNSPRQKPQPPPPRSASSASQRTVSGSVGGLRGGNDSVKPEPPPARKRMVAPAWEGERMASPSPLLPARSASNGTTASHAVSTKTPPPPPAPRNPTPTPTSQTSAMADRARSASSASVNSTTSSQVTKRPPPKPTKPSALASMSTGSSTSSVPQVSSQLDRSVSSASTGTVLTKGKPVPSPPASRSVTTGSAMGPAVPTRRKPVSGFVSGDAGDAGGAAGEETTPPPPLPARTATSSILGITTGEDNGVDANDGPLPLHPPAKPLVKQRKGSQLQSPTSPLGGLPGGWSSWGSASGGHSGGGVGQGPLKEMDPMPIQDTGGEDRPGLPPRRGMGSGAGAGTGGARADASGLMDMDVDDGDGGGLGSWEVLKPKSG